MSLKKFGLKAYNLTKTVFGGYGIGNFYPFKVAHDYLYKSLKSDFAIVQGHKMFLDSEDTLDLSLNGIYEPFETELVNKEVNNGDVVLDIVANIGYFTLIFSKLVRPTRK